MLEIHFKLPLIQVQRIYMGKSSKREKKIVDSQKNHFMHFKTFVDWPYILLGKNICCLRMYGSVCTAAYVRMRFQIKWRKCSRFVVATYAKNCNNNRKRIPTWIEFKIGLACAPNATKWEKNRIENTQKCVWLIKSQFSFHYMLCGTMLCCCLCLYIKPVGCSFFFLQMYSYS